MKYGIRLLMRKLTTCLTYRHNEVCAAKPKGYTLQNHKTEKSPKAYQRPKSSVYINIQLTLRSGRIVPNKLIIQIIFSWLEPLLYHFIQSPRV